MEKIETIDKLDRILSEHALVIVKFSAEWCGPCRQLKPLLESVEYDYRDKVMFIDIDVDRSPEICSKLNVRNVPTTLLIKNGVLEHKIVGLRPRMSYTDAIDILLE